MIVMLEFVQHVTPQSLPHSSEAFLWQILASKKVHVRLISNPAEWDKVGSKGARVASTAFVVRVCNKDLAR